MIVRATLRDIIFILCTLLFVTLTGGCGGPEAGISVITPLDGTLFPPDMASPLFQWADHSGATRWRLRFEFADIPESSDRIVIWTDSTSWTPPRGLWEKIKSSSMERQAALQMTGYRSRFGIKEALSGGRVTFSTSKDSVGAPIFFRAVTLPFEFAVHNMETIKWCLGDVSSDEPPKVVLEDMPVCANCHSFSADGSTLAMDVDYANDKGSYIITGIERETVLSNEKVISWSDYRPEDGEFTFGLLSQISPDGRYAISTVKDRSVFVPRDDPYYSQLFFPLKGILVYYDRARDLFRELSGADDARFVQSNPCWSPDGSTVLFARGPVGSLGDVGNQVLLTRQQCDKYLSRSELLKFDLYTVPFNDGKGGEALPLEGASNNGMSNYFGRYSPDGRWIVFCRASSFMLLQPDSRLYILPSKGGTPREMSCNTDQMNSWHSWSPNGRWLVFSSKSYSPYTQLLLTHVDEGGVDTPPVLLSNFFMPDLAANIPEFVNIDPDALVRFEEHYVDYYSYMRTGFYELGINDEKAEQLLRKSIELNPRFAHSRRILGYLLERQTKLDSAESQYLAAIELEPENVVFYNRLGAVYANKNQPDKARQTFRRALAVDGHNAAAYQGLAELSLAEGDTAAAVRHLHAALESDPGYPFAYKELGRIAMARNRFKEARELLGRALNLNDSDAEIHNDLGRIYVQTGQFELAGRCFELAFKLNPEDPETHNNFGSLYTKMQDYDRASASYRAALALDPDNVSAHEGMGSILLARGELDRAEIHLRRSLEIDAENDGIWYRLGTLLVQNKRLVEAQNAFESALKVNPANLSALHGLGLIFLNNKEYGRAADAFRRVWRADPDNPNVCLMLAKALAAPGGDTDEAIRLYRRVEQLAPGPQVHLELGNLHLRRGEKEKARTEFEKALRLDPGNEKLKDYLSRLESGGAG